MKKLILSLGTIIIALTSFGQAPEGFKYQAVVRDASNKAMTDQAVGMQITIKQGSIGVAVVYQETFAPTTNGYGLVNLEIEQEQAQMILAVLIGRMHLTLLKQQLMQQEEQVMQ